MAGIRKALIGAVAVTTAALTMVTASPAFANSGKDKDPARITARADSVAPDQGSAARTPSATATAALATIQSRIANYVATNGTRYTFASYLDAATGKIVVSSDAPAAVVDSLTKVTGATARGLADSPSKVQVQVRNGKVNDLFDRRNDTPSFYGGGGITDGGALCSSGYAVQNSAGTRFMTTAGHCFADGSTVYTESGVYTYGTVSNRHLPIVSGDARDMELIGGQSYSGRIFTGGVTSSTSIPVVGAGSAVVGYTDYCHSGRTTGENCGHTALSITGQVCTSSGCKSPVIVFNGGNMIQGGDSGGTFYAKTSTQAWVRGNVIATDGTTGYATPWTEVAATLGVSIVTG